MYTFPFFVNWHLVGVAAILVCWLWRTWLPGQSFLPKEDWIKVQTILQCDKRLTSHIFDWLHHFKWEIKCLSVYRLFIHESDYILEWHIIESYLIIYVMISTKVWMCQCFFHSDSLCRIKFKQLVQKINGQWISYCSKSRHVSCWF